MQQKFRILPMEMSVWPGVMISFGPGKAGDKDACGVQGAGQANGSLQQSDSRELARAGLAARHVQKSWKQARNALRRSYDYH